jgi:hypothetical protein
MRSEAARTVCTTELARLFSKAISGKVAQINLTCFLLICQLTTDFYQIKINILEFK